MTATLNSHRRELMAKARTFAEQAQCSPAAGLIRGDVIKVAYEDLVDMFILVAGVCPVEVMTVAPAADVIPCPGCDGTLPVTQSGRRYCSEACRKAFKSQALMDRRAAA